MAKDFGVQFLGRVPIDPQFGMLVEAGRKPVYPEGTLVNGKDMSDAQNGVDTVGDEGLLVEKYRDCSLCPIFQDITKQVMDAVDGKHSEAAPSA